MLVTKNKCAVDPLYSVQLAYIRYMNTIPTILMASCRYTISVFVFVTPKIETGNYGTRFHGGLSLIYVELLS